MSLFAAIAKRDEPATLAAVKSASKEVVNASDPNGHTPLNYACASGFSEPAVLKLIELGADVSKPNMMGTSPLMHVMYNSFSDNVTQALVKAGADVNYKNPYGCTALHVACMSKASLERIQSLVKLGANVNAADSNGHPPLITAVRTSCDFDVINYLAGLCQDINLKTENDPKHKEWTALHFAASLHNPGLCATLIKKGADISAKNWAGNTPEMLCDEKSKTAMLSSFNYVQNIAPYLNGGTGPVVKPGAKPGAGRPGVTGLAKPVKKKI